MTPMEQRALFLGDLRPAAETQTRAGLDSATVGEYAEILTSGGDLPAIAVFYDETTYWVADGFHRIAAAIQSHRPTLQADIYQGGRDDAIWFGLAANITHGRRETTADKRAKVIKALETFGPKTPHNRSDSELARQCGVSHPTVAARRAELYPPTLKDLQDKPESEVTRNGVTYTQKTGNIGKTKSATVAGTGNKKPLTFASRPVAAERKAKEVARKEAAEQQERVDAAIAAVTSEEQKRRHLLIGIWLVAAEHLGNLLSLDPVEFAQLPRDSAYDLNVESNAQRLTAWAATVEQVRQGPLRRVK